MKPLFYLLCILFPLLGSSCASKRNVLANNQVSTRYATDGQETQWDGLDARKKIQAKKLRVLVVDQSDTENKPQLWGRLHPIPDDPFQLDTVMESGYYNRLAMNAFHRKSPLKADISVLDFPRVSAEEVDSLKQTGEYDLIIAVRLIRLQVHSEYYGRNGKQKGNPIEFSMSLGNDIYDSFQRATGQEIVGAAGPYFRFRGERIPIIITNTIRWNTCWDLYWKKTSDTSPHYSTNRITQEGKLTDHTYLHEEQFVQLAQKCGESLAKVFVW